MNAQICPCICPQTSLDSARNRRVVPASFKALLGLAAVAGLAFEASAQQMYGIMFRTGGQTSGLNPILYDVNLGTGAATNPRNVNVNNCVGIAVDPTTGVMYGLTDQFGRINNQSGQGGKNLIFTINPATGAAAGVGRIDPSGAFQEFEGDIAFNPVDGSFWGVSTLINSARLFQIDKTTGAATLGAFITPLVGTDLDISALTFDAAGNMYVLDTRYPNNPGPAILERIDPGTGAVLQSWTTSVSLGNVAGMAFSQGGGLFVADGDTSGTNRLYRFDFVSGDLSDVGPTGAAGGIYQGLAGLAAPCNAPAISTQPLAGAICGSQPAGFSVSASGSNLFYRWELETSPGIWQGLGNDPFPLACGPGAFANAFPANSPDVQINVRNCPGPFRVRCVITGACGSATSSPADLTIGGAACCASDFNHDGTLDPDDLADYISAFFAVPSGAGSDFNGDGTTDPDDLADFIAAFFAGC